MAAVCRRHFSPLARSSCAPTNALTPCPDPPHPISAIPDRSRPSAVPRNGAATEQNGKKRPDGGRKRCCGRQPKGTSGRGDPWPGMCSRGQPRGASKALLPAQLACYSARASDPRGGSRWGSCHRPGAATSARGARQDAQEGAVAWGWGAHASVCRPASAGCAPPTLSASELPLSERGVGSSLGKGVGELRQVGVEPRRTAAPFDMR